jgi:hypothetical protein
MVVRKIWTGGEGMVVDRKRWGRQGLCSDVANIALQLPPHILPPQRTVAHSHKLVY